MARGHFQPCRKKKMEKNLTQKIIDAKKSMGGIVKSSENPFFKSKYADLSTILAIVEPALLEQGILISQPINNGMLETILTDGTSEIRSSIQLGVYKNPQDLGKEITYLRRYLLSSILSLSAEDNDGGGLRRDSKKEPLSDERFEKALKGIKELTISTSALDKYELTEEQQSKLDAL